jgi:hypothetical protein
MKHLSHLGLCLAALLATPASSQEMSPPTLQVAPPALTKFNLDFPGGSPNELVAAIEKSSGRPLNTVVPNRFASLKLPPLKMKGVDVAELFQALGRPAIHMSNLPKASSPTNSALGRKAPRRIARFGISSSTVHPRLRGFLDSTS